MKTIAAAIWKGIGCFLGGFDGPLTALVIFMILNCIIKIVYLLSCKRYSWKENVRAVGRILLIFVMVGLANILDVQLIDRGSVLRIAVILFYLSCEGREILLYVHNLGLPVPDRLWEVLQKYADPMTDREDNDLRCKSSGGVQNRDGD